ncbi:MAG: hypothetical protein Q9166_007521 [cf. Caloplaca sp. 2 TL-2023]
MSSRNKHQDDHLASQSYVQARNGNEVDSSQGHAMSTRGRTQATHAPSPTPDRPTLGSLNGSQVPQLLPTTPSRKSRSPPKSSSPGTSPGRSPGMSRSLSKTITTASSRGITKKEQLAQMQPAIEFCGIGYIKNDSIPEPVKNLWVGYIQPARDTQQEILEVKFNTPMKTNPQIADCDYGPKLFDTKDMMKIADTVIDVLEQCGKERGVCHEPQWVSEIAGRLITDVRRLSSSVSANSRRIRALNISTVLIAPQRLCPTSLVDAFADANKKVDYAFALDISDDEKRTLSTGGTKYRIAGEASINQTYNWTAFQPMFANFEIKTDDRDPLVQLGTWIAAEYEKRYLEGYPTNLPVPAVVVDKDYWTLWIACSIKLSTNEKIKNGKPYRVQFLGPVEIGNTTSAKGIFKILHFLTVIVQWGFDVYEPEFFTKVLAKYKKK